MGAGAARGLTPGRHTRGFKCGRGAGVAVHFAFMQGSSDER
jgi:hypothetical protein